MKYTFLFIIFFAGVFISVQAQTQGSSDFNRGWKFHLGNESSAKEIDFDDSHWQKLDLPHDWSIEGQFDEKAPATTQGGALPGGIGWYRKTFRYPETLRTKNVYIEFDGIYRNSEVWINGHYLGKRPNGYISFRYELTSFLRFGKDTNVIAVKVDNSQQPNSRWYSGSGIYRNVRLVSTGKIAIDHWGTFITSTVSDMSKGSLPGRSNGLATIKLSTRISSNLIQAQNISMVTMIFNSKGKPVTKTNPVDIKIDSSGSTIVQSVMIKQPELWSIDKPELYSARTQIFQGGKLIDEYDTPFGIRTFDFDPAKGFSLNGQPMKIKGVCMHHDLGALGAAVNTDAIERQLKILKEMGCNAIRTAHNPPAPEFLDLCDRMGFLVIDEAFDMWKKKKNKYDYALDFEAWHKQDLEDMVKRDRNHPSVIIWSIGNEIREQFDSTGISISKELVNIVKSLDSTRPVTSALSESDPAKNFIYKSGALDLVGLNYHQETYADFPLRYPGQKFIGTENMSALASRGHYDMPSDSIRRWPAKSPQKYVDKGNSDFTVSAYDNVSAYWGSTHEESWKIIKKYDFLSGLFVWTGFDYLGEPTPYPWPARSSYFGIIDLAGFPKDVYYMYQSEWTNRNVLHLFPHWTGWEPGKNVDLWAYYNNADEVELYLNGQSMGIRKKTGDDLHVMWRIPFKPGTLKAVSRKNGKQVMEQIIKTAGKPYRVELVPDKKTLVKPGKSLCFVTIRILDKEGNLVPTAENLIKINLSGDATLIAMDNGFEADTHSFKDPQYKAYNGLCLAVIKAGTQHSIQVQALANGLKSGKVRIEVSGR